MTLERAVKRVPKMIARKVKEGSPSSRSEIKYLDTSMPVHTCQQQVKKKDTTQKVTIPNDRMSFDINCIFIVFVLELMNLVVLVILAFGGKVRR